MAKGKVDIQFYYGTIFKLATFEKNSATINLLYRFSKHNYAPNADMKDVSLMATLDDGTVIEMPNNNTVIGTIAPFQTQEFVPLKFTLKGVEAADAPVQLVDLGIATREVKIAIVGSPCVGKSSFIQRLQSGSFTEDRVETMNFETKRVFINSTIGPVRLTLLDCPGQFGFVSIEKMLQGVDVILLFVDGQSATSMGSVNNWLKDFGRLDKKYPVIVVATKCDKALTNSSKKILGNLQRERKLECCLCSSKTGEGLDLLVSKCLLLVFLDNPEISVRDWTAGPLSLDEKLFTVPVLAKVDDNPDL